MYEKQKRRRTIVCGERYRLPDIKLRVDNIFFIYIILTCAEERRRGISRDKGKKKKRKKEGGYMKRAANKTGGSSGGGGFMAADFESSSSLFSDLPGPPKTTVACFLYPLVEDDSLDLRGKSQKKAHRVVAGVIKSLNFGIYLIRGIKRILLPLLVFFFPFFSFANLDDRFMFCGTHVQRISGQKKKKTTLFCILHKVYRRVHKALRSCCFEAL